MEAILMLTSSKEYLHALRTRNYLRFLEWPQFIAQHYSMETLLQDADATLNLIVFEWLNNGFCEEDVKSLAVLSAIHNLEFRPLRGNLAYSLTAISIAAFQCMVYQNNHLQVHYLSSEQLDRVGIEQLMKTNSACLKKSTNEEYLKQEEIKFKKWVKEVDVGQVEKIGSQIRSLTQFRYLVEEYLSVVESNQNPKDSFQMTRISVIKRLANYLNEQMEITAEVIREMDSYVQKLWELNPSSYEVQYLTNLSSSSFASDSLKYMMEFGLKFFKILQPRSDKYGTTEASSGKNPLNPENPH
jgi:hypothetical protein